MRNMVRQAGERIRLGDKFYAGVQKSDGGVYIAGMAPEEDGFQPMGVLNLKLYDKRGVQKGEYQYKNLVVNQGKNDILGVYFNDGTATASSSWFMGLIVDTGFTGIVAADTAASHAGWAEFTGYSQSTRPLWGQGSASGQAITNASPVTFSITSSGNLKGGFIITNSTIGGSSGKLWAAALFTSPVPVTNGDQMKATYNLSC